MASNVCPLCLSEIGKATSFKCPGCGSKYHKDCAADAGECIVVGCSAAAKGKTRIVPQPRTTTSLKSAASGSHSQKPTSRIVLIAAIAASLLIGIGAGYTVGDSAGYDRGYSTGESAGYERGYSAGNAAGYAEGKADGDAAGYRRGYNEGIVDGCEWVFEQSGYYSYVTAYNPFSYYNRYPGRYYVSKSNCS